MLHDYGFYKFEKFANYLDSPESQGLKPLFTTREQFLRYDECSQLIGACFQFLDLRLKCKAYEGKIASKLASTIFNQLSMPYSKSEMSTDSLSVQV